MKKIFLFFGIAAFSSASAQQNDLFDIQKHLQKKQTEDKKKAKSNSLVLPFNKPIIYTNPSLGNRQQSSYTLPNGDKVVTTSPYNMPCIQPDMRQYQTMPNVAYGNPFNFSPLKPQPGQIPNGAGYYQMIVSK